MRISEVFHSVLLLLVFALAGCKTNTSTIDGEPQDSGVSDEDAGPDTLDGADEGADAGDDGADAGPDGGDDCQKDCSDRMCGEDPVCHQSCGDCPQDQWCDEQGQCQDCVWEFEVIGTTDDAGFFSLHTHDGKLFAGTYGTPKSYTWDGTTWQEINGGDLHSAGESLFDMVTFSNDGNLYGVTESNGKLFRFNGTNWSEVFDTGDEYVNGYSITEFQGYLFSGFRNYPGQGFKVVRSGNGNNWLTVWSSGGFTQGRYIVFQGYIYVLGIRDSISTGEAYRTSNALSASWDSAFSLPGHSLGGGRCVFDGKLYIGTEPWPYNSDGRGSIYSWDGSNLVKVFEPPQGDDAEYFAAIHAFGSELYAASRTGWSTGGNGKLYRSKDGSSWELVYSFDEAEAWTLEEYQGELYAGTRQAGGHGKVYKLDRSCGVATGCRAGGIDDASGLCSLACGSREECDGLAPLTALGTCGSAGNPAVKNLCNQACTPADESQMICSSDGDCSGDPSCDGKVVGTGGCDNQCQPFGGPYYIKVWRDGMLAFDYEIPESLIARNLTYVGEYHCGDPPVTPYSIDVVVNDPANGVLELDLIGFPENHGHCDEKWCFVDLEGDCANVLLEKWNKNPDPDCTEIYPTDSMKLETWIDQNDDCNYQHEENQEPYSLESFGWNPDQTYRLRMEWD